MKNILDLIPSNTKKSLMEIRLPMKFTNTSFENRILGRSFYLKHPSLSILGVDLLVS
jgi:hypothetical protein